MHGTRDQMHSLFFQGRLVLERMLLAGMGRKKHDDKHEKIMLEFLYMVPVKKQYEKHWKYFCDWIVKNQITIHGRRVRSLDGAALVLDRYVDFLKTTVSPKTKQSLSASTIRSYFTGVAKVLKQHAGDYDLPFRIRADFKKGRHEPSPEILAKYGDLILFASCTGLRKNKELRKLRGSDLVIMDDGRYGVHVLQGKGGLERFSHIVGTPEEINAVVARMQACGDTLVWPHIPHVVNIHNQRAHYACKVYKLYARPVSEIPREERYICRTDWTGIILDRKALAMASHETGHRRLSVIVESYLYPIKDFLIETSEVERAKIQAARKNAKKH